MNLFLKLLLHGASLLQISTERKACEVNLAKLVHTFNFLSSITYLLLQAFPLGRHRQTVISVIFEDGHHLLDGYHEVVSFAGITTQLLQVGCIPVRTIDAIHILTKFCTWPCKYLFADFRLQHKN